MKILESGRLPFDHKQKSNGLEHIRQGASRAHGSTDTSVGRLISAGSQGARDLLRYCSRRETIEARTILSPKARTGLQQLADGDSALPIGLQNALEHMLKSLKQSGHDLERFLALNGDRKPNKERNELSLIHI